MVQIHPDAELAGVLAQIPRPDRAEVEHRQRRVPHRADQRAPQVDDLRAGVGRVGGGFGDELGAPDLRVGSVVAQGRGFVFEAGKMDTRHEARFAQCCHPRLRPHPSPRGQLTSS
jgi:hypothetical protein